MMYCKIDQDGFYAGQLAEQAVNEHNRYIIVETPLPNAELGQIQSWRWVNNAWVAETDYRGHAWYNPDDVDQVHEAKRFDDAPPAGWSYWTPGQNRVIPQAQLIAKEWVKVRAKRNQLLADSDWTDTLSAKGRLGQTLYDAWQAYRQGLRDITQQPDPFNLVWPNPPA